MISNRPDIQAEQMAWSGEQRTDDLLTFHSFRFEVFDLPPLDGEGDHLDHAGEIMAVAVSDAGSAIQKMANARAPNGLITQHDLAELNANLQKMADQLTDAISALTDAAWWVENENMLAHGQSYDVIIEAGQRAAGQA